MHPTPTQEEEKDSTPKKKAAPMASSSKEFFNKSVKKNQNLTTNPKIVKEKQSGKPVEDYEQKLLVEKQLEKIEMEQGLKDIQTLSEQTILSKVKTTNITPNLQAILSKFVLLL